MALNFPSESPTYTRFSWTSGEELMLLRVTDLHLSLPVFNSSASTPNPFVPI